MPCKGVCRAKVLTGFIYVYVPYPAVVCKLFMFVWSLHPRELSLLAASFLFLLLVLFAILLASRLGGQGAHGVADGLVVGVHTWKILQDTLKKLWGLASRHSHLLP